MSKKHNNTNVSNEQVVAVVNPVREARLARAQQLRDAIVQQFQQSKVAQRVAKLAAIRQQQEALAKRQAFELQVAELASQYGIDPKQLQVAAPRANSATDKPSTSVINVNGELLTPCKAVHALAAQYRNRKDTLAACKLHGINPATAATQWNVWKKKNLTAEQQQEEAVEA